MKVINLQQLIYVDDDYDESVMSTWETACTSVVQ
jgi:hypothetical protein